jgi:hypothetical protein
MDFVRDLEKYDPKIRPPGAGQERTQKNRYEVLFFGGVTILLIIISTELLIPIKRDKVGNTTKI